MSHQFQQFFSLTDFYNDAMSSEKVALEYYRNHKATFKKLSPLNQAEIATKHPKLILEMMQDKSEAEFLTTALQLSGSLELLFHRLSNQSPLHYLATEQFKNCSDKRDNTQYLQEKQFAENLYDKPALFNALNPWERVKIALSYSNLTQKFIQDKGLNTLPDYVLNNFVTCIVINAQMFSSQKYPGWRYSATYGADLSETERNQFAIEIAKQPELLIKLNPAARVLLLSRLKDLPSSLKTQLPVAVQKACESAYDFLSKTARENAEVLSYYHFGEMGGFWLPVIAGMAYNQSISMHFNDVVDYCLGRGNYKYGCESNQKWFVEESAVRHALALTIVMDPQFEKGYDRGDGYFVAKLKPEDRKALIDLNQLENQMAVYRTLTQSLEQELKVQQESELKAKQDRELQEKLAQELQAVLQQQVEQNNLPTEMATRLLETQAALQAESERRAKEESERSNREALAQADSEQRRALRFDHAPASTETIKGVMVIPYSLQRKNESRCW